jgi:hypothetical protein
MHTFAASCLTAACIYVVNAATPNVTVYGASANGNVAPVQTISGFATRLMNAFGVGVDSGRNIYATSFIRNHYFDAGSVLVYATGANGNVSPIRDITGGNPQLDNIRGIALGPNNGTFVTNDYYWYGEYGVVTAYPSGANGDVSPVQTIFGSNTGLNGPWGIAVGPHGGVYVTNIYGNFSVTVYSPGANGNVSPVQTISGSKTGLNLPEGIALGANGAIYVANSQANSVTVYALGANGNVAPVRTISGSNTGLKSPAGVAVGSNGAVYVANTGDNSLTVYPPGANGNIRPVQTISGSNTGLNNPRA